MIIFIPRRLALNSVPPRNVFRAASHSISCRVGIHFEAARNSFRGGCVLRNG